MKIAVKFITTIACVLFFACAAVAQTNAQQTIGSLEKSVAAGTATHDQQLDLARAYIQVGRFYEASQLSKRLLDNDPNDAGAIATRDEALKGLHALAQDKVNAAETNAKRQGATDEDRLALANAYFEAGDYRSAADAYGRLPQEVMTRDMRLRQARALAWSSRLDDAERKYAQLVNEHDTPDLQLEYGRVLSWMGASRAAATTLRTVYERDQTEDAAIAFANARAWSGDREGAIKVLSDFTLSHPTAAQANTLLAQMRTSPDLAIERVDRSIDLDPFNLALRMQRAHLLYDAGRYAQALKEIQFVRQHTNEKIEGIDELEQQAKQRRTEEIAKLDERMKSLGANGEGSGAMTSSGGNADELLDLAKAYTALAAYDQAITLYERYLRMRPDDTQARINYARVLSWDRRYAASQRQYQQLVRLMPDRADLRYEYAQTLSWNSDYVPAIHALEQLTDISGNPRSHLYPDVPPKAYYSLGQIYRWYGWNDTAIASQNHALSLDSSFAPARQELTLARDRRPASTLGATYGFAEDSTNFQFRRFDVDAQKWTSPNTAIEGSIGRHMFSRNGTDVSSTAASVGGRYRGADAWTARARVGANLYDSGLGTRPFWNIGADFYPTIQSRAAIDYNHYDLVYDVFNIASLGPVSPVPNNLSKPLDIDDFRGRASWDTGGFWSFLGDASYGFISDDNKRAAAHGLASFRLFKEPFVAIKGEGRWLSYDRRTSIYWSPTSYHSLAAVLQVGMRMRLFSWNVEGKAGKAYEKADSIPGRVFVPGTRTSDLRAIAASVTVPVSSAFDVVGSYGYGKSGRFDSVFASNANDFTSYWQRHWYVGVRLKRLFTSDENRPQDHYYYDNRVLSGSPVLPPVGETH